MISNILYLFILNYITLKNFFCQASYRFVSKTPPFYPWVNTNKYIIFLCILGCKDSWEALL